MNLPISSTKNPAPMPPTSDAAIAAQAVLCVVAPEACGLGGDVFCLVREPGGAAVASGA